MNDQDRALAAARADADRQIAHVNATINDYLLPEAQQLVADHDPTDAWATLSMRLQQQLTDRPAFLADMLACAAIRLLNAEE